MTDVTSEMQHVDYPHNPGRLHDCYACEQGPCVCTVESAPCVSWDCTQVDREDPAPEGCPCPAMHGRPMHFCEGGE